MASRIKPGLQGAADIPRSHWGAFEGPAILCKFIQRGASQLLETPGAPLP